MAFAFDPLLVIALPLLLATCGLLSLHGHAYGTVERLLSPVFVILLAFRCAAIAPKVPSRNRIAISLLVLLAVSCIGFQFLGTSIPIMRFISGVSLLSLSAVFLVASDINSERLRRLGQFSIFVLAAAQIVMFIIQSNVLDQTRTESNDRFVGTYINSGGAVATYVVGLALLTAAWRVHRISFTAVCYLTFGVVCFWTDNRAGFLLEALAAVGAILVTLCLNLRLGRWARAIGLALLSLLILCTGLLAAFGTNPQGGMMPGVGRVRDMTQVTTAIQGLSTSTVEVSPAPPSDKKDGDADVTCGLTKTNQFARLLQAERDWVSHGEFLPVLLGKGDAPVTFLPTPFKDSNSFKVCSAGSTSAFLSPNSSVLSSLGAFGVVGIGAILVLVGLSLTRLRHTLRTGQIASLAVPLGLVLLVSGLVESIILLSSLLICLVAMSSSSGSRELYAKGHPGITQVRI